MIARDPCHDYRRARVAVKPARGLSFGGCQQRCNRFDAATGINLLARGLHRMRAAQLSNKAYFEDTPNLNEETNKDVSFV